MSIKSEWKKAETWWKAWWNEVKRAHLVDNDPNEGTGYEHPYCTTAETPKAELGLPVPSLASCWEGSNAQARHMNELSFHFPDETVGRGWLGRWGQGRADGHGEMPDALLRLQPTKGRGLNRGFHAMENLLPWYGKMEKMGSMVWKTKDLKDLKDLKDFKAEESDDG